MSITFINNQIANSKLSNRCHKSLPDYIQLTFNSSLRKVKMDQRKLNDNANTLVDMAKVSITFIQLRTKLPMTR